MITIRAKEGTATYVLDPYPHWVGDDAMMDRGEALRALVDTELKARVPNILNAPDRSQRLHRAFVAALIASGITIVEAGLPDLDPPYDSYSCVRGEDMANDADRAARFVQPGEGIAVISSPVLTAKQIAEMEQARQEKLRKMKLPDDR